MSSIVTAVFKVTIGLLVNKGRDKTAERLGEGDVTGQKFRGLTVRELDDIKSKLDGISRKYLVISPFSRKESNCCMKWLIRRGAEVRTASYLYKPPVLKCLPDLAEEMRNVEVASDCILAMEYRVMTTILEIIDNPADAVAPCRVCSKELKCVCQQYTLKLTSVFHTFVLLLVMNFFITLWIHSYFGNVMTKEERCTNI